MFRLVLLCLAATAVLAQDLKVNINSEDSLGSGLKVFLRLYDDCAKKESGLSGCLKMRAITFFDRASRAPEIPIMDSFSLVKSSNEAPTGRAMSESELEATLPDVNDDEREGKLDSLLMDRVAKFFSSRKVQFNMPKVTGEQLERSFGNEGRGKKKGGMMGMMMMGIAMKMAALVPIAIGKLFLLAGKALIISKIALVLALIIALKKILAQKSGGGHEHMEEHHSHGWDRRALDTAHDLAYSAHVKN